MLVKNFKKALKENGQNIKWFYDKYIKDKTSLGYSGFSAQLNGYAPLSEEVETELTLYINKLSD